jgi:hypothetical protein
MHNVCLKNLVKPLLEVPIVVKIKHPNSDLDGVCSTLLFLHDRNTIAVHMFIHFELFCFVRTACVIAVAKARDTFEPFLHQVSNLASSVGSAMIPHSDFVLCH